MPRGSLLLLLLLPLGLFSAEDADYLEVYYQQKTITPVWGSSARLTCEAHYNLKECGVVHVVWQKYADESNQGFELINPKKYFTTVNETAKDPLRRRQVVTEIMDVVGQDEGTYQCKAECETGAQAMGHFISVQVRGQFSD